MHEQTQATYRGVFAATGQEQVEVNSGRGWHELYRVGYHGSGPADLALALLRHHFSEFYVTHRYLTEKGKAWAATPLCWRYHQDFKREVLAQFPQARAWTLTGAMISAWVGKQPALV